MRAKRRVSRPGQPKTTPKRVYALETFPGRVQVTFRAFPPGDLESLAGHVAVIAHEKHKRRELHLICQSRRCAEAIATMTCAMFSGVVWKRTPTAPEVPLSNLPPRA